MDNLTNRYVDLAAAVVLKAMEDYKTVLKKVNAETDEKKKNRYKRKKKQLEQFFLGDYGQLLSAYNGQRLIEKCRKEVEENKEEVI